MSRKVLITGVFGFLGSNTALKFQKEDFEITGIGIGSDNNLLNSRMDLIKADINSENLRKLDKKFDIIVHCAGGSSVGVSVAEPYTDFKNTVLTSMDILEYIRIYNSDAKLIYPSSAAVYGSKPAKPMKETDSLNPVSPYGYYKKIVEELCELYYKNYNIKSSIIRFFSIYGEGLKKQLLWDASKKISKSKNDVEFFGTGEEIRDWIHVKDAANLIFKISQLDNDFKIFNGASGESHTIRETLHLIKNEFDFEGKIVFNGKVKEGDPKYYIADTLSIKELCVEPTIKTLEGIKNYVRWFKENHD